MNRANLENRARRLLVLLRRIEWATVDAEDVRYCTVCDWDKSEGHESGCDVGELTKQVEVYNLHEAKGCKDRSCRAVVYHHAQEDE